MLTREADYALRTILYLTAHCGKGGRVSATELSDKMEIPYRFLRNITRRLVKAELLISHRGQQGGLELAREAGSISLLDVMRAVSDRACYLNTCLTDVGCDRQSHCPIHTQLVTLQMILDKQLSDITFDQFTGMPGC